MQYPSFALENILHHCRWSEVFYNLVMSLPCFVRCHVGSLTYVNQIQPGVTKLCSLAVFVGFGKTRSDSRVM